MHKDAEVEGWEPAGVTHTILVHVRVGKKCVNIRGKEGRNGQTLQAEFSITPEGEMPLRGGRVKRQRDFQEV